MSAGWIVRRATAADEPAVRRLAAAAWRDTYAGLLDPATIEAFIERAYSAEHVAARIAEDHVLVAEDEAGVAAFADAIDRGDRIELAAIYADPERRYRGAGTALLATLTDDFPGRDVSADVLNGNRKGEVFYERRGFVPRERLETTLIAEPVIERRWWLHADRRA